MDMEKLKQWMEVARRMDQGDFWKEMFDGPFGPIGPMPGSARSADKEEAGLAGEGEAAAKETAQGEETPPVRPPYPAVDIFACGAENWVVVELPGFARHEVSLTLAEGTLMIRGIAKPPPGLSLPLQTERFYGPFERAVPLPDIGELSPLRARFEQGLLLVRYTRRPRREMAIPIE